MTKINQKRTNHMKHFGQMMMILIFLFSISLSYVLGMLYQKSIDMRYFRMQKHNYEEQRKQEIEQASKEATMKEMEDWKTYTNKKFVFEIKHPLTMTPKETVTRQMTTILFQKDLLSLNIKASAVTKDATDSSAMDEKTMEKYGLVWKLMETKDGMTYETEHNNFTYTFTTKAPTKDDAKTIDMIMSTFKFTDVEEDVMTIHKESSREAEASKSAN